ncbi:RcnB family protein [Roseixanthobacter glucoisosaccharinicivorans]|uniref:RcnB family protein n=1 Tax=Roseixanthobacter glucoisosaccharinicivorans TaxID=3119923 RepID=UPI003728045F
MMRKIAIFAALMVATSPAAMLSTAQAQPAGPPGYHHAAPPPGPHGAPAYHHPPHAPAHPNAWRKKGGHVPHGHGQVVTDYRRHGLRQPPRGYHWVRDGNNYILAGITSGIISSILNATR